MIQRLSQGLVGKMVSTCVKLATNPNHDVITCETHKASLILIREKAALAHLVNLHVMVVVWTGWYQNDRINGENFDQRSNNESFQVSCPLSRFIY